jgi:phosphoglycerate dehydrogenase-like enzyme
VIKNADLDVVGGEVPERAPLCVMDKVVLLPYLSGNTEELWQNRNQLAHQNLLAFLNDKALINQVY